MNADQYEEVDQAVDVEAMVREHRADMELAVEGLERAYNEAAQLLAEKVALRTALAKFDPTHPLLTDEALCDRIRRAGSAKYQDVKGDRFVNWSEVGHASDRVKYDYTPPQQASGADFVALKKRAADAERANVKNCVEKMALQVALKRVDRNHPLVRPEPEKNPLIAALHKAGLMAFSVAGYEAAAEAGRTFRYPDNLLCGQRTSALEAYPGEIDALAKRLALLRSPQAQLAVRTVSGNVSAF